MPPLASPGVDLLATSGSVVGSVQDASLQIFVESGEATLQGAPGRRAGRCAAEAAQRRVLARAGGGKSTIAPRAAGDFVQQLPRSFLDTLPARAALFRDRDVPPKAVGDIAYADVQPWLTAEPALRRPAHAALASADPQPGLPHPAGGEHGRPSGVGPCALPEKYLPKPAYPGGTAPPR